MTPDNAIFDRYLLALRKTPVDEKTEHTDRLALETLLQALADETQKGIKVQHEPKRVTNKGAPDFKVTKSGLILGYVENKAIGEALDKVLKSEQIAKYKTLSQNIIVTDYLHFAWINKDGIQREPLCHETDLENQKFRLREDWWWDSRTVSSVTVLTIFLISQSRTTKSEDVTRLEITTSGK